MATFGEMQTEVNLWLIDTPTAIQQLVPKFINRAIRSLQNKHNFKTMEATADFTTAEGSRGLVGDALTYWKEARGKPVILEDLGRVRELQWQADEVEALSAYGNSVDLDFGRPRLLRRTSDGFDVYPYPDGNSDYDDGEYRIRIPYWAFTVPLAASSDTNWFTENTEEAIIFGAVTEGFYANEDEERAMTWETRTARKIKEAIHTDKTQWLSETDTFVPHLGARMPHTQE